MDYSEYLDQAEPAEPATPAAPAGTGNNYPTVRKGDKGELVKYAQNLLISKGYALPKYGADGDFGSETLNAVKAFQKANGLTADGVIGAKTWAKLQEESPPEKYAVVIYCQTEEQAKEIAEKYNGKVCMRGND